MNHYESPGSRAALGMAALAMSALTLAVLVVMPARMEAPLSIVLTTLAQNDRAGGYAAALALHVHEGE